MFLALVAILALVSLPTPSASQGDNTTFPLPLPATVINSQQALCPPGETLRGEIHRDIQNMIHNTIMPALCDGQTQASSIASCSSLSTSCSSGYYWVRSHNGTAVQVYCDMDRVCGCNSTGGWMRIAHLNTSDPSQQCPNAWRLISTPRRMC